MTDQKKINKAFFNSFIITLIIFSLALFANYGLDFFRMQAISSVMGEHSLSSESYLTERLFLDAFGGNECTNADQRLFFLKEELKQVGLDLTVYSTSSWFHKQEFDLLRRNFYLMQLKLFSVVKHLNEICDNEFIPIIFFYEAEDIINERQGFVLSEVGDSYQNKVFVMSFDKDYEGEPLLEALKHAYNITSAPTIIIEDNKLEGIHYSGQINATIINILRKPDPYTLNSNFSLPFSITSKENTSQENQTKENTSQEHTFISQLKEYANKTNNTYLQAEAIVMDARLKNNKTQVCESFVYYDNSITNNSEQEAMIYETTASLGCGRNKKAFYKKAQEIWQQKNNTFRAELAFIISTGKTHISLPLNISQDSRIGIENLSLPVLPVVVKKINTTWYAADKDGVLRFSVPKERVYYPNTRFYREDLALLVALPEISDIENKTSKTKEKTY